MPGIRFAEVRARVTMAEVLGLVGFVPMRDLRGSGAWTSPGPSFRVTVGAELLRKLTIQHLHIHKCWTRGNHPVLCVAEIVRGAFELRERLDLGIPWMLEETSRHSLPDGRRAPDLRSGR